MNTSWVSPQNYYHGDRWSPDWCSDTKIPRFLRKSAPLVANIRYGPVIGHKMLKLTSTHEGLSIGPSKKKPSRKSQKFLDIAGFLRKKFLSFGQQIPKFKSKWKMSCFSRTVREKSNLSFGARFSRTSCAKKKLCPELSWDFRKD